MKIPFNKIVPPQSGVEPETLKKAIFACCCGKEEEDNPVYDEGKIIGECRPIWLAFKLYDFNLDRFMSEKGYEQIDNEELCIEVLMGVCFLLIEQPISRYIIDWLNGYLDFFEKASDIREDWEDVSDTEILRYLYYCQTDEEIWNLLAEGIGDMPALYKWYKGLEISPILEAATGIPCYSEKDDKKAEGLLDYLLAPSINSVESVRKQAETLKRLFQSK